MQQLRIGVIGLGVIARFYLAALDRIPSLRLVAVCDTDDAALRPFRERLPCHRDHHELLRRTDLDAVVITVPNDAHATVGRDVLAAGLPVCLEKPLATQLTEGEALLDCARTAGVCLFTAFHRRYNWTVQTLARRLRRQPPVESLTVRYLERIEEHIGRDRWYLDPARCGGGCVADNGPNAYDLARLFLGELAVTDADIGRDARGIDRQARVVLRAASGATARVELDWSYPGERKDVEIILADGSTHHADMLRGYPGFTISPGFKDSLWHEYLGILRDFERTLAPGEHRVDGGLAALALVDATYRTERERYALPSTGEGI
ncbi:MAG: Gfo/Idh/MocA family protein [Pseudonocardiaceae bacterium]